MEIPQSIERVLVVGAGWVGRQVAARMAQYGLSVALDDSQPAITQSALAWMASLDDVEPQHGELAGHGNSPAKSTENKQNAGSGDSARTAPAWFKNVTAHDRSASGLQYDLVVECVPEQVSLKKRVLRQLSSQYPAPTIIASNSSYFVPSVLVQYVSQPERFAHLHFHVPVLRTSVADIVAAEQTDPRVPQRLAELVERIGHQPLVLNREHPGYIFNWLLQSVLKSALQLSALDVASPQDIDRSWKAVTGMPVGPFGMMDQIGLDVIEQVLHNSKWANTAEPSTDELLAMLRPHIQAGHLGTKTQRGFYDYAPDAETPQMADGPSISNKSDS